MEPQSPCIPNLLGIFLGWAPFAPEEGKGQLQHHCQWREVDTRMDLSREDFFWRMKRRGLPPSNIEPKVIQCFEGVEDGMYFLG